MDNPQSFSNSQVPFELLPRVEELTYTPLEKNYLWVNLFGTILGYAIFIAIVYAVLYFGWIKIIPAEYHPFLFVLLGLAFIFGVLNAIVGFRYKGYALRQKDMIYKSGWLNKSWTHVPFNRIQHSEVTQGVLDRFFQLSKLKIYTAGGSKSDMVIPGLKFDEAHRLKDFILANVNEDSGEEE